ncbi:MAG: ATP-dependent helicase DeaD [Verrucomicrobiota bacterium]|jgi:ATP-dependent RNA helicase DeaD|nr:ATP-dependent helicase DeaD [Verrucomicrobiota bacterium]
MKFNELGLSPGLLDGISRLGFEEPTPVQAAVIPMILNNGRDLVALAQTGTGKTAAFGLPVLQMLDPEIKTPQALILCPTRELCMQIARDLESYAAGVRGVRILAVYGGADIKPQLAAMVRGVDIAVATPGRMVDLLRRKRADFSKIKRVVLDEADEMLNMGFEEDLEAILSEVPEGAQTLLFSATMPRQVSSISRKYMNNPEEITVGTRNAGAENVSHDYLVVHAKDRYRALKRLADFYPEMYGIVFCRTRQETQEIADHLSRDGYNAEPLHGDLTQQQRDRVMKKFRARELQMLVATDVAARGLDVNDLTHIVNYSLPDDLGSYTHRSGRTGRAGKTGVSIALINMREHYKVKRIEKQLGCKFVQRTVPTGADICKARLLGLMERLSGMNPEPGLIDEILPSLCERLEDVSREELLRRFASLELQRLLDYYKKEPDLNAGALADPGSHAARKKQAAAGGMAELVMNVGKLNRLSPKQLMNLVNVADRNSSIEIGRINIVKMQAYFEVPRSDAQGLIDSFSESVVDFEGRQVSVAMAGEGNPAKRDEKRAANPYRPKDKKRKGGKTPGHWQK